MKLLADWKLLHGSTERKIELLQGDLAHIPPDHAVDVLVVSAFPNDYLATRGSLIGALHRAGLSLSDLSRDKQDDLRHLYSCWLSKPVKDGFNFRQILCIESGWRGTPPEITDDIFRALGPYLLSNFPNGSVAMPLIGAGDQGWPPGEMLEAILRAAIGWFQRGLPLKLLKIVVHRYQTAQNAVTVFGSFKKLHETPIDHSATDEHRSYDIFMSYAREEADMALFAVQKLRNKQRDIRIFYDQASLREGSSWLMQVADALDSARRVVALYSPSYWDSKNCQMEFLAAFTRQNDTGDSILFPIYLDEAKMPYMFRNLQYVDCRVNDRVKVSTACSRLAEHFG